MRFILLGFLFFSGCALFRSSVQEGPLDMVRVPGGTFEMGDVIEGTDEDATPVHTVTIYPFSISRYEVTYAQYDAWAEATGHPLPDDTGYGRGNRAVANVTWDEAKAFCEHYGYRLPTEMEWEYAARSAGQPQRFAGTDSTSELGTYARFIDNTTGGAFYAFQVGIKAPNALGLYDMSGNVYEWIGMYYPFYPKGDEQPAWYDLATRDMRLLRGGSFKTAAPLTQTFRRVGTLRDVRSDDIGFRCVHAGG